MRLYLVVSELSSKKVAFLIFSKDSQEPNFKKENFALSE